MARKPREDLPDSWHHVVNRGIAKRPLFETRADMRFFLARLARQVRLRRVEVHAFCLMGTHFHLLLRSPMGSLSEAMRRVQNEHSRRFNRLHRRDGALVRGRFFSRPVHSYGYRCALIRYIDANPVRAGIVQTVGDYEFGSAAAYLGRSDPPWLTRTWVEAEACASSGSAHFTPAAYQAAFGGTDRGAIDELYELVEVRARSRSERDPFQSLTARTSTEVRAWIERKIRLADGRSTALPMCGPSALRRALDREIAEHGTWMVEDGRKTWRGAELAWIGLLRDLVALSWREIARLEGDDSEARARRLQRAHRRLLEERASYAQRVVSVAAASVSRGPILRTG